MKLRHLLSAIAGIALFASCVEEEPVASYDLAIKMDKSVVAVGPEGGSATVAVNSGNVAWTATSKADWITFNPTSGKGETNVTVTVGASDEDRTGEVILKADQLEALITVVQTGDPHGLTEDDPLTCAEAVTLCLKLDDKAKTPKKYYVKGIITKVIEEFGTQYGNATFWMGDTGEEDQFEVYRALYLGNVKYDDPSKQNIGEGDEVLVYGILMNYGGTPETSEKEAYVASIKSNTDPVITTKEAELVVAASETEAKFTIAPKNLTEGWTVTTTASWITDYTKSGAKDATEIVVKFAANTDPAPREATFTVKSAGAKDLTLTLKQGGYTAAGTLDKPYKPSELLEIMIGGGTVAGNVYIKGIISNTTNKNYSADYNTASFWISDDGTFADDLTKDFEIYGAYWLGGDLEHPTASADIKANFAIGDEVIVYGAVTSYTSSSTGLTTYETVSKKNKIYSLNWATTDENGVGNADYPFNIAGAQKFIDDTQAAAKTAKDAGETLTIPDVCVKGKVSAVYSQYSSSYHTAIFWISEDGTFNGSEDKKKTTDYAHDFEAYSVYWLENKEWEEGMGTVKEGDDVILKGQYTIYNGLYETASKKAYLYSLNGQTEDKPVEVVPALYLNEFDCANKKIEIYNSTDAEVDMTGWVILKNDGEEGEKDTFVIPAALGKVAAKGYAVFTCKQTDAANGPKFGLSGTKGFKIALKKGDAVVDEVDNLTNIVTIEDGQSWGRETDGADKFVIFDTPTIGASNGAAPAPAAPKTIAELLAAIPSTATGNNTAVEVDVDFTDPVTVSYVNGKNAYLEDATGAILLYLDNHGLQAGFTIKGQLKVKGYWYNGIPELVSFSGTPTVGQGTVPETAVTIAQLLADYNKYLLRRVKLTDVKVTDGIADGDRNGSIAQADGSTIAVYAQINNGGLVLTAGDQGNLLTIPGLYNANKQVYFWQNDWWESTATDLPPTITIADITGVPAAGVTDATATVTFANNEGWEATATPDGTVVTAASIDGTTLKYTVAENTAYQARDGKITITLKKDGKDNVTKDVKVSQKAAESTTLAVGTVLWSENWDGAAANDEVDTYNYKSTTVFGGGNVTYTFTDAGTNTKMYVDNQLTGGENDANLLVSKGNGSFAVAGLPAAGVAKATLTIWVSNKNYPLVLSTTTEGVTLGERTSYGESSKPYKYTWEITLSGVTTFDLTLTNTYSSNNRLDNMSLVVTELADEPAGDNGSGIPDYDPINGFTW